MTSKVDSYDSVGVGVINGLKIVFTSWEDVFGVALEKTPKKNRSSRLNKWRKTWNRLQNFPSLTS
ncbi:MAG TPA: hypothetical protein PLH27_01140 [bacterium]|nr:hypothetical protein [bacterium]HMW33447.1 hypothetical protein [bacterium]HMW36433.1 hypothetical protein [bacterium]HMY35466.1 hypothetical protein [bacterium]HNB10156.1 hypothetical protein [bacterium]